MHYFVYAINKPPAPSPKQASLLRYYADMFQLHAFVAPSLRSHCTTAGFKGLENKEE